MKDNCWITYTLLATMVQVLVDTQQVTIWLSVKVLSVDAIVRSSMCPPKLAWIKTQQTQFTKQSFTLEISDQQQGPLSWLEMKSYWNAIWCSRWDYQNSKWSPLQSLQWMNFMFSKVQLEIEWYQLMSLAWQLEEIPIILFAYKKIPKWVISMLKLHMIIKEKYSSWLM